PADAEFLRLEIRHADLEAVTQRVDTEDAFVRAVRDFAPTWCCRTIPSPSSTRPRPFDSCQPSERLSPRQLEVLRLLAQGYSTREIARRLKLSVKTIETHRAEAMKRLDIHEIAGLVRYAVRVRLISAES